MVLYNGEGNYPECSLVWVVFLVITHHHLWLKRNAGSNSVSHLGTEWVVLGKSTPSSLYTTHHPITTLHDSLLTVCLFCFSLLNPNSRGEEADGWCDGGDSSVPFCATVEEDRHTNSYSQITSSAMAHC